MRRGFLSPFGHRHWLFGSSCSRPGRFSSPHSRPTRPFVRLDPDGVSTFHTSEKRPGWVPSLPRGRWCSPRPDAVPDRHLPLHNGQSLHPTDTTHLRGSSLRDINEGSRDSPVRSAPNPWPPDGTRTLRRSLKLRTPPSPAAHVKGGAKTRARARNYATDNMSALQSASPLAKCNLVSQQQLRMFATDPR